MPNGPRAAREQKALAAVLFVDLVFVGKIVPDSGDMKVAGLDDRLHRLSQGRLHALLLVLRLPGRAIFKILRIFRNLRHERVHTAVGHGDEALRGTLGPASVAINLDEAVSEIDRRIVLHPVDVKMNPVFWLTGLVIANKIANHLRLRGLGHFRRLFEIRICLRQILGVEAGRYTMIRRSRAINLLYQLPIDLRQARVEGVVFGKAFEISQRNTGVEIVRAGLQNVQTAARTLGGDQRLKVRIE